MTKAEEVPTHLQLPKQFRYTTTGYTPQRKTAGSVGYDLQSTQEVTIEPGEVCIVSTGLSFQEMPDGYYLEIVSRSGLATKGVFVVNAPAQIDNDYRGEIKVILGYLAFPDHYHTHIHQIVRSNQTEDNLGHNDTMKIERNVGYKIEYGDRIAQLVIHKVVDLQLQSGFGILDPKTQIRGTGGFGSTGK